MSEDHKELNEGDRQELSFLAEDTAEGIRDVRNVSRAVLISYSAVFGFVWHESATEPSTILTILLLIGAVLVICVCGVFLPFKRCERRRRLKSVYECFGKKFNNAYGSVAGLDRMDLPDYLYLIFVVLYPIALAIGFCLHQLRFG